MVFDQVAEMYHNNINESQVITVRLFVDEAVWSVGLKHESRMKR